MGGGVLGALVDESREQGQAPEARGDPNVSLLQGAPQELCGRRRSMVEGAAVPLFPKAP
jgi:hypothetical protein